MDRWVVRSPGHCRCPDKFLDPVFLNAEALGVFNQIYASYASVGQLTVFGIHDSVLKHVAEFADNEASRADFMSSEPLNTISVAGVMCGMGLGLMGALLLGRTPRSGDVDGAIACWWIE